MMTGQWILRWALLAVLGCGLSLASAAVPSVEPPDWVGKLAELDLPGGLVVQWGAEDVQCARDLVGTGRYLVHILAPDAPSVIDLRDPWQKDGLYGLIAAEPHGVGQRLPYTENLVNLFLVQAPLAQSMLTDVVRVLCPRGIVMARRDLVSGEQLRGVGLEVESSSRLGEEWLVAGDGIVALLQGSARRGETIELVVLEQSTGRVRWRRSDLPWLLRTTRLVYHRGMVACEVSTLNDDGPGNELHIVSAQDGQVVREFPFLPGMNHMRQARAMFVDERLWLLQGGRLGQGRGFPLEVTALDVASGEELARYPAGLAHCFPPIATPNYLLSGEMDFTDLRSGKVDANRITKAACGRDAGWFLAHGLVYVTPKHCVCWQMQIAPLDERIVAYGQLESPWPVPGSILVIDDTA